jgi:ribulose kinase
MLPRFWINEGRQIALGKLIDHIIEARSAFLIAKHKADEEGIQVQQYQCKILH